MCTILSGHQEVNPTTDLNDEMALVQNIEACCIQLTYNRRHCKLLKVFEEL